MSGASRRPDAVASTPATSWKNTGRKKIPPRKMNPLATFITLTIRNVALLNNRSGTNGSRATRSRRMKSAANATHATASKPISNETHWKSFPPVVVSTTSAASDPVNRPEPMKSIE